MDDEKASHDPGALLTMPLEEAMRTQRAIRRFKPDPVDDELLLRLIELATKAPSGGGRQYAEFIIVRDPKVKGELARLNRLAWSTYGTIWRWVARNDEKTLREMKAVDHLVDHYEEVPALVVACVRWNTYGPIVSGVRLPFPPFMASIYYGSIFPAVQNFLLAARAAGLGASLTVMPLWSVFLARRALGMPIWSSPVAVIPVGWPVGRYGPTTRPPVSDYVHYDTYGRRSRRTAEGVEEEETVPSRPPSSKPLTRDPDARSSEQARHGRPRDAASRRASLRHATLERAIAIALDAHRGQVDKGGQAYVRHPLRVMERVRAEGEEAMILAVLHDVVEDGGLTVEHLRAEGLPETVLEALPLLTKGPEEHGSETGYDAFIQRIATSGSRLAIAVKLADLADNGDLSRLGYEPTAEDRARAAQYERARRALEAAMAGPDPERP